MPGAGRLRSEPCLRSRGMLAGQISRWGMTTRILLLTGIRVMVEIKVKVKDDDDKMDRNMIKEAEATR